MSSSGSYHTGEQKSCDGQDAADRLGMDSSASFHASERASPAGQCLPDAKSTMDSSTSFGTGSQQPSESHDSAMESSASFHTGTGSLHAASDAEAVSQTSIVAATPMNSDTKPSIQDLDVTAPEPVHAVSTTPEEDAASAAQMPNAAETS